MLVPQMINDFVTDRKPEPVCNQCITSALRLIRRTQTVRRTQTFHRAQTAQITATLATTSDFECDEGVCSICGSPTMVIRAKAA